MSERLRRSAMLGLASLRHLSGPLSGHEACDVDAELMIYLSVTVWPWPIV